MSGMSTRGLMHGVVACNGQIVHDPHPDRSGVIPSEGGYFELEFLLTRAPQRKENAAALLAMKCALADLEGLLPEHDADGERTHPGWRTVDELKRVISMLDWVAP